jgi:adenylate cyclase
MSEATFLFADLAGFTALTEAHGDLDAADVAGRLYELSRECLAGDAHIVKTMGDGVLVAAPTVRDGLLTALRLSAAANGEPLFPLLRAGLHAGEAVARGGDYFGGAVNLASRILGCARAGETLCTAPVATVARADCLATVVERGCVQLRNLPGDVNLFEIIPPFADALVVDPVCRMRVSAAGAVAHIEVGPQVFHFCSMGCADRFRAAPDRYVDRGRPPAV